MRTNAKQRVKKMFTKEVFADQLVDILQKMWLLILIITVKST